MAEDTDMVCGSHSREARTLCREKVGGDSAERMTLLRPDRAMVQTDRRLRDTSCIRHQTCHGIPISWTTPQRPRASARISRGAVRTVEVPPCEEIRCAIPARVAEGRHHHSSASGEGMALHRCWNLCQGSTAFHLVLDIDWGQFLLALY
jgi:hypothetical protein